MGIKARSDDDAKSSAKNGSNTEARMYIGLASVAIALSSGRRFFKVFLVASGQHQIY